MSPLSILKFIVDYLQGSYYEKWVNALLFMVFVAAVFASISFLIGKTGRSFVLKTCISLKSIIVDDRGFAPEYEQMRSKIEPYFAFVHSLYFALIGLCSGLLVSIAMLTSKQSVSFWHFIIGTVWTLASFGYMRVNLVEASWAYHTIKNRK